MSDQEVFQAIGQYIVDAMPDEKWLTSTLKITIAEQSVGLSGTYESPVGLKKNFNAKADFNLALAILKFHSLSNENLKNRWNILLATLDQEMNLKLEYEWDQEMFDEVNRLSKT